MNRDWDKLRRYDRAKSNYGPIESFKPIPPRQNRRRKFKKRHNQPCRSFYGTMKNVERPSGVPRSKLPEIQRVLCLTIPRSTPPFVLYAVFHRRHGRWSCVKADDQIDWFTRIRNLDLILSWIHRNRYSFQWLQATPVCKSAPNQQTDDSSARPQNGCTTTSLNNATQFGPRDDQPANRTGLEQNGIDNPRCLMPRARALETEVIKP